MSSRSKEFYSLCFICFGNICRSPALAAIFESLAEKRGVSDKFFVDSMALTTYYLGRQAEPRMRLAAGKRQIAIDHVAKLFNPSDFQRFDYLFPATRDAAEVLLELTSTPEDKNKILLATAFSKKFKDQDIPDPYYNGPQSFDRVVEIAFDACEGILDYLLTRI